ncbi:MAG: sporulation integral membrane protein YtvI [Eubacteriales bacterium]
MELLPKEPHKRIFCVVFYTALAVFVVYIFFRYLLPVFLPFIIAFAVAAAVRRPSEYVADKTGAPKKLFSVVFGLLLLSSSALIIGICFSKLMGELSSFVGGIMERREDIISGAVGISERIDELLSRIIPGTDTSAVNFRKSISELIIDASKNIISGITVKIPAFIGYVFSGVPRTLFFIAALVISAVYFCLDFEEFFAFIKEKLAKRPLDALTKMKRVSFLTFGRYIRACFFIFIMTATELTVGFLFLRIRYALLLGVVTAFIDILPVFGSGTVLIPYAVIEFIKGNFALGIGLVALYGIVTLVRQISEPRIMGKSLGIHPIISLLSVYAGYRFFGVIGMIFLPLTAVMIKNLISGRETA